MRALIQRVSRAEVRVEGSVVGAIEQGLLVLLGAGHGDGEPEVEYLVKKVCELRIFEDDAGKMNLSVEDVGGSLLVVSQFTLYGDTRKGRRPSFVGALEPNAASLLVKRFIERAAERGLKVASGIFGADMAVELINDGPVTLMIESRKT